MSEPIKTEFRPRWQRNASPELLNDLANSPVIGSRPLELPRIVTRILPSSGANSLSANTVSEVIELTQKLASYAANDEIHGFNPDFAGLNSMDAEVLRFSKLTIEPFEEGSFIIAARLEAPDYSGVTTESVVKRFGSMLADLGNENSSPLVSIGALQTVQQLNRSLKREANAIEFSTFDRFEERCHFYSVDNEFIAKVDKVIKNRRPSTQHLQSLDGEVTALDTVKSELQLSVAKQRQRVKGSFHVMLHPTLLESLGKRVRLFGTVTYTVNRPVNIAIQQAEILNSD